MSQLQEEFLEEVHKDNPGLVPGMPSYINWLEARVKKLNSTPEAVQQTNGAIALDAIRTVLSDETAWSVMDINRIIEQMQQHHL